MLFRSSLAAFSPKPDSAYGIMIDVVTPAPIPSADTVNLQLGPEELDLILGYAHHLAAFKEGGAEFEATIRQYENLIRGAAIHNEKLRASAIFANVIHAETQREEARRPRRRVAIAPEVMA